MENWGMRFGLGGKENGKPSVLELLNRKERKGAAMVAKNE